MSAQGKTKEPKLTPKQLLFAAEFMVDLNGTAAAIRAGYSPKSAKFIASETLRNPTVAKMVEEAKKRRLQETEITGQRVLQEYARIAFANLQDFMTIGHEGMPVLDWANLTRDQAAALAEVTVDELVGDGEGGLVRRVRFKTHPKMQALAKLGEFTGVTFGETEPPPPADIEERRTRVLEQMAKILQTGLDRAAQMQRAAPMLDVTPKAPLTNGTGKKGNGHG